MKILKFLIIAILLIIPWESNAQTTKTFTENFSSIGKIEPSASYAFIDTKHKEATLPLKYSLTSYAKGLQGFAKSYITTAATDGSAIMVGGANGALNFIKQGGMVEDLSGLLAGKMKKVNAVSYAQSSGWWLVGGEGKTSTDGAPLFKLVPGGLKTEDLQAETKNADIKIINEISCLGSQCVILGKGKSKKLALYNGSSLSDLSETLEFKSLLEPIRITNNGVVWLITGTHKDVSLKTNPFIATVYSFDGSSWQNISLTTTAQGTTAGTVGSGWNGQEWLVMRGKPKLAIWKFNSSPMQDATSEFLPLLEKASLDPVIGSDGTTWFLGGRSQWKGLVAKNQNILTDLSTIVPELKSANVFTVIKSPWKGVLLAGSSTGAPLLMDLNLENYASSAAVESKTIATAGSQIFKKAKVTIEADIPSSTGIDIMLSGAKGKWESFTLNQEKEFTNKGNELHWRAVLFSNDTKLTPRLKKATISYTTEMPDSPAVIKTRDAKRIGDLKSISSAIKKFKKDKGAYPVTDAPTTINRWQQLTTLLQNAKILTKLPNDPLKEKDEARQYDYFVSGDGKYYLLLAQLEDAQNKSLAKDVDGTPLQIVYATYSCDDPIYCEGEVLASTVATTPAQSTTPPSMEQIQTIPPGKFQAQLVKDPQGKVWRIVNNKKKLYIASPTAFFKMGYLWSKVKNVSKEMLDKYPKAKLLKIKNKPEIYILNDQNKKRHIPTWQAFIDYGFKLVDTVEVQPAELAAFSDTVLVKLQGDKRVWKIQGNVKKLIPNPDVFKAYGFKWDDITTINWAEFNAYSESAPLK